jgi:hypothetical protein
MKIANITASELLRLGEKMRGVRESMFTAVKRK